MAVNHVVLVGHLTDAGPKLGYSERGTPECRLTLMLTEQGKAGQTFNVFVPVFIYGDQAEHAASTLDAGDLVSVDGRLSWKSALKKDGTKLGLCVTTFAVDIISKAPTPVAAEEEDDGHHHRATRG
jgi:single-stranded DNA-binding protein